MPPRTPGEPGEEHGAEEPDRPDEDGFRPPLPPEDRIWRHPSEVARERAPGQEPIQATMGRSGPGSRTAALAVVSGMIGATLAVAAVALLGGFDTTVVERAAPRTVTSASGPVEDPTGQPGVAPDPGPATSADDGVADVAARAAPAVAAVMTWTEPAEGDELAGRIAGAQGSAVVLRRDGYLVTSAVLVEAADEVTVHLSDGTAATARVVAEDPGTDIAVLHVDRNDLVEPALAAMDDVVVGSATIAVGALADAGGDHLVSTGIVSALGRRLQAPDGTILHGMMLVDAPFAPGATGGALVDERGRVLGITSGLPATGQGGDRFGVATPVDVARHVAGQLIEHGHARHGWMGIEGTDLDVQAAMALDVSGAVQVEDVVDDSPAARAGIVPGDVIVAVDDRPVRSMSALIGLLQLRSPGEDVAVEVLRVGGRVVVRCALGDRPAES